MFTPPIERKGNESDLNGKMSISWSIFWIIPWILIGMPYHVAPEYQEVSKRKFSITESHCEFANIIN
jgi:hypothetical protein